jgi:hypothetical protein
VKLNGTVENVFHAGTRSAQTVGPDFLEAGPSALTCSADRRIVRKHGPALMLLLFAGGVMNLTVIIGLTVFVLVEKIAIEAKGTTTA